MRLIGDGSEDKTESKLRKNGKKAIKKQEDKDAPGSEFPESDHERPLSHNSPVPNDKYFFLVFSRALYACSGSDICDRGFVKM